MRGWLMVLAVLAASVTYQADDSRTSNITTRHSAGNPVLSSTSPVRYGVFVSFNASAFVTSLFIIGLLLKKSFFHEELRLDLLRNFLNGNNTCLIVAFAVGSSHELKGPGLVVLITIFRSILYIKWELWKSERKLARRSSVREEGDA
ncbi:hypothetical protein J5N97_005213 [Dioscorea zingiberensis]|uniref:PGG domain-containing protein n=1 Tax=Dioscorea zingiberensis TaxID=325984 RepID=A0A9D5D9F4_9LILI|nr:hypothetical protein J5N97_005213 [Dioscorea zingiberensis]